MYQHNLGTALQFLFTKNQYGVVGKSYNTKIQTLNFVNPKIIFRLYLRTDYQIICSNAKD